jgi:hypothetical protein
MINWEGDLVRSTGKIFINTPLKGASHVGVLEKQYLHASSPLSTKSSHGVVGEKLPQYCHISRGVSIDEV